MPPEPPFLLLPFEIREQIYLEYMDVMGSSNFEYIFNHHTGKLRRRSRFAFRATQHVIDNFQCLMYTCKQVAAEMKGLPFHLHKIVFTTYFTEDVRNTARFFNYLHMRLFADQVNVAYETALEIKNSQDSIHPATLQAIKSSCPSVWPFWKEDHEDIGLTKNRWPCWGEVPSIYRQAQQKVMLLLASDQQLVKSQRFSEKTGLYHYSEENPDLASIIKFQNTPWDIPTNVELNEMARILGCRPVFWNNTRRFSAAAVAIRWLNGLDPELRKHIRSLELREDYGGAVGYPECHAIGLIPFCKENPRLRIQRRLSLYNNVQRNTVQGFKGGDFEQDEFTDGGSGTARHWRVQMTRMVAEWLAEASVLYTVYGMPQEAFTLVLDHERVVWSYEPPSPIRFLLQAAEWQAVSEEAFMGGDPLRPWRFIDAVGDDTHSYQCKNFPAMIEALVCGRDTVGTYGISIRKNFKFGNGLWTRERIREIVEDIKNKGMKAEHWSAECGQKSTRQMTFRYE
ncbi:hypothetical protein B0T21DRAFT_406017 [Apiosordaria backusii]|uniref:Uncharacterized protein n=1 Tax=Apiosordaria backusii TaxID=314023 RepID=A0AA40EXJ3_9PEZI|nr:hypothetical protein B0T21DRAFT_406017 [Apiosordaria backusii]